MNGPELWDQILGRMPPGSVIAGGAVRDYLLGVEPKDIDVFMGQWPIPEVPSNEWSIDMISHDPRMGLCRIDDRYERQEEYTAMTGILLVSTGEMFGHRVDAVEVENFRDGINLVMDFDFGVTRCWYDGEVHDTPTARRDRENKTVTLLRNDRRERALARFARFNARMGGDWRLVEQ